MTADTHDGAQSRVVQDGLGERLRRFFGTRLGMCVYAFLVAGVLYLIKRLWLHHSPEVDLVLSLGCMVLGCAGCHFLGVGSSLLAEVEEHEAGAAAALSAGEPRREHAHPDGL